MEDCCTRTVIQSCKILHPWEQVIMNRLGRGGEGLKDFGNVTIKLNLPDSPLNGS